jgi:cell division protein FtsB
MKSTTAVLFAVLFTASALAQNPEDLQRRVQAIEERLQRLEQTAETAELRREIDVLTHEIEALKSGQQQKRVEATTPQYGLGAAASKVYRSEPGVAIGGYGDMLYQNFRSDQPDTADLLRGVVYAGYKFNRNVLFNSEIEVEHGSTEHGGAVSMEFAYLDYLIRPQVNVRAGLMLMPIGLINEQHEPTAYLGAQRPNVETLIIPSTWSELGAGVFGDIGRVSYRAYITTGLNSEEFRAQGIREGRQGGAEALANDWAAVARADVHPFEGTILGASLRGLWSRGSIGDAVAINSANGLAGNESIGRTFGGWYMDSGYDVASILPMGDQSLMPFLRYERFDPQRSVPAGFFRNPENDARVTTFGVAYKPIPQTVIKVDWQNVTNRAGTGVDQLNVALGYIF